MPEQPRTFAVIGTTEAILGGIARDNDAHVTTWRRWKFLYESGIVGRDGITLVGRNAGKFWRRTNPTEGLPCN